MFVAVKYLIHTAVIVQKIHLSAAVPHAEKFFHIKCLDFPGITFASHLIIRQQRRINTVALFDAPFHFR